MDARTDRLAEALRNCDRDPIHIPGHTQSFGHLFATDLAVSTVAFASAGLLDALERDASAMSQLAPDDILDRELLHTTRNVLGHDTSAFQREFVGTTTLAGRQFQVSAHRRDGHAIIELIPEERSADQQFAPMEQVRRFAARHATASEPRDFLKATVIGLRALVDYDRVKAYVFLPGGDGEVVAESRRADVPSFLGLRFPASDIPQRARKLYASTPIRIIADVDADNVPLLAAPSLMPTDLDQSLAVLRGTDEVHSQYLRNMGLRGSLSIPIVVGGDLYGLFACHHREPRAPDGSMALAAELAGKLISLQLEHMLEMRRQREYGQCISLASRLFTADDSELSAGANLARASGDLMQALPCDGLAISVDGTLDTVGDAPPESACHAMFALGDHDDNGLVHIVNLGQRLPDTDWASTAGALIVNVLAKPRVSLAFLRNAAEQSVDWAGAPEKDIEETADGVRLTPRSSFARYVQSVRGRCDDWSADNLSVASAMRRALVQAIGTQQDQRNQRQRLGLLVRELNHRVRNILSLVQSLSVQSRESATSVEHYADLLEKRIIALSGAHNLLTQSEMRGVALRKLAVLELEPYVNGALDNVLDGPDVWLRPEAAPIMALLLHELTSNAVKYGALSTSTGQVRMNWFYSNSGLAIQWRESGGPAVAKPTRRGFGSAIVEHALPYEVGGRSDMRYAATGVEADLWLPGELFGDAPGDRRRRRRRRRRIRWQSLRIVGWQHRFGVATAWHDARVSPGPGCGGQLSGGHGSTAPAGQVRLFARSHGRVAGRSGSSARRAALLVLSSGRQLARPV